MYDPTSERFKNEQPVSEGRIVHYVCRDGSTIRPAIVVKAWNNTGLNLQVFYDGSNDNRARVTAEQAVSGQYPKELTEWVTSVAYDGGEERRAEESILVNGRSINAGDVYRHYNPYTWHWPPRT